MGTWSLQQVTTNIMFIRYPLCKRSDAFLRNGFHWRNASSASRTPLEAKWRSVVGLEVHAQISSESKLFSGASTDFISTVNQNVSFFDAAIPGTLPVLNRRCVEAGIRTAIALSCKINPVSLFDRKHYFYADLPAGYQITQQRLPLACGGKLEFEIFNPGIHRFPETKSCRIHQLQLEQDSGKSIHDDAEHKTLIDLNRAGIPLMEIVFEPDLETGEQAAALVRELLLVLQIVDTCSCKMDQGALRVDANISIHREGEPLGVRTEVKNIPSLRGVQHAVDYEIERQMLTIKQGLLVENETRVWDAQVKQTLPMRDKEEKQDYRFMPEPNLPPLRVSVDNEDTSDPNIFSVNSISQQLPELPCVWRERIRNEYGVSKVITFQLMNKVILLRYFQDIMAEKSERKGSLVANYLVNIFLTVIYKMNVLLEDCTIKSSDLGEVIDLIQDETISMATSQKIVEELLAGNSQSPKNIVEERNLKQIKDIKEITKFCETAIERNPGFVKQYHKGKTKLFNKIFDDVIRISENRVHLKLASQTLSDILNKKKVD